MKYHQNNQQELILWGGPHSFYTGKVRSYLIKKGLPFRELLPSHPHFSDKILPRVGHFVIPVVELPDGRILQDSTIIIDELERLFPERPMTPPSSLQRAVATLLGGFGSEGMISIGLHYRWSYLSEQEHFLNAEFGRLEHTGPNREERLAAGAEKISYFTGFLPNLGVTPETIPAFEHSFEDLLEILDIHFQHYPYLMGGHPSIADFGFMTALYGHLSRDPVPSALMKNLAPNAYRWTERMNLASIRDGEFFDMTEGWLPKDTLPESLEPLIALMFRDWGTQLIADANFTNQWILDNPNLLKGAPAAADGKRTVHPALGHLSYAWRDVIVKRASAPQGLWHFERGARLARELEGEARERFDALIDRVGGREVMQIHLVRPIERQNDTLVIA